MKPAILQGIFVSFELRAEDMRFGLKFSFFSLPVNIEIDFCGGVNFFLLYCHPPVCFCSLELNVQVINTKTELIN